MRIAPRTIPITRPKRCIHWVDGSRRGPTIPTIPTTHPVSHPVLLRLRISSSAPHACRPRCKVLEAAVGIRADPVSRTKWLVALRITHATAATAGFIGTTPQALVTRGIVMEVTIRIGAHPIAMGEIWWSGLGGCIGRFGVTFETLATRGEIMEGAVGANPITRTQAVLGLNLFRIRHHGIKILYTFHQYIWMTSDSNAEGKKKKKRQNFFLSIYLPGTRPESTLRPQ